MWDRPGEGRVKCRFTVPVFGNGPARHATFASGRVPDVSLWLPIRRVCNVRPKTLRPKPGDASPRKSDYPREKFPIPGLWDPTYQ